MNMRNLYVIIAIFLLVPVFYVGADDLSLASARWGTPTDIISGDAGSITPLTVFLMNNGNGNIAVINATLYMQEPLSSPQGDRYEVVYPKVQVQNNWLRPGDVIPVTFTVNIPSYAAGMYNFSLVVHYNITRTSTAPPVYVQTGGTVLYSPSTTVTTSSLEKASFRFRLPVSQKPSIKVDRIWTVLEDNSAAELNFIITNSGDREIKLQSATVSGDIIQVLNPTIYINEWLQPGSYYRLKTRVNVPKGASSNGYALVTVTLSYAIGTTVLQKSEVIRFDIMGSGAIGPEITVNTNSTSLIPGKRQRIEVLVRNVGDQTAERVKLVFQSGKNIMILGSSSIYLGDMPKGSERKVCLDVLPSSDASDFMLPLSIEYTRFYEGEHVSVQKQLSLGFSALKRAEIEIVSAQARYEYSILRITGTLANTGNLEAKNVKIRADCGGASYMGSIKEGDTASFYLTCGNTTAKAVGITVEYEASPGEYRSSNITVAVEKTAEQRVEVQRGAGIEPSYAVVAALAALFVGIVLGRLILRR
jgi:hypothetical protein